MWRLALFLNKGKKMANDKKGRITVRIPEHLIKVLEGYNKSYSRRFETCEIVYL